MLPIWGLFLLQFRVEFAEAGVICVNVLDQLSRAAPFRRISALPYPREVCWGITVLRH